jgi:hypothetical protein
MISLQAEGRRLYFAGNTYPVKNQLRALGATWDGARKAWWVGSGKREQAEQLVAKLSAAAGDGERAESISLDARVIWGRVEMGGHKYYLLAEGTAKSTGKPFMKLAWRDGSKVFWAKEPASVVVLARYEEPKSIQQLRDFAAKAKTYGSSVCKCACHSGPGPFGSTGRALFDGCDKCGCEEDG